MKRALKFFLVSILLSSCATFGTKTLYKTTDSFSLQKIGFCNLDNDSIVNKIYPNTSKIFAKTVINSFNEYGFDNLIQLQSKISYENPDLSKISELCKENNLDGFLISRLRFIHVTYSVYFIPVGQNYDTEVEMKLFDNNGKLLLTTKHNTYKGNSYMMPPSPDRTITDGTNGTIKRIVKEMNIDN